MKRSSDENNMFRLVALLLKKLGFWGYIHKLTVAKALDQAYAEGYLDCLRHTKSNKILEEEKIKNLIDTYWSNHR